MKFSMDAARPARVRAAGLLALVVALAAGVMTVSSPASAGGQHRGKPHHDKGWVPQVEVEVECAPEVKGDAGAWTIWFTAESWREDEHGLFGNERIEMAYQLKAEDGTVGPLTSLPWQPTWRFGEDDDFWFDDAFGLVDQGQVAIRLRATASPTWSDGEQPRSDLFSKWITLPQDCTSCPVDPPEEPKPTTTTTAKPVPTTTAAPTTTTTAAPTTTTPQETTTTTAALPQETTPTVITPVVLPRTELPVTGGRSGGLFVAAGSLLLSGVLLLRARSLVDRRS